MLLAKSKNFASKIDIIKGGHKKLFYDFVLNYGGRGGGRGGSKGSILKGMVPQFFLSF